VALLGGVEGCGQRWFRHGALLGRRHTERYAGPVTRSPRARERR
jgi:hypothetical protein